MRVIEPSYEILTEQYDSQPTRLIEAAGRVCYKSEDKIGDGSDLKLLSLLRTKKHESVLEHAWFHVWMNYEQYNLIPDWAQFFITSHKVKPCALCPEGVLVSGNARALRDMHKMYPTIMSPITTLLRASQPALFDDLDIVREVNDNSRVKLYKRFWLKTMDWELQRKHTIESIRFICNRGFTHELVRHRRWMAYSQESTRYCNYSKAKFGEEITVINPQIPQDTCMYDRWLLAMKDAERAYSRLITMGATPQIARGVLPIDVKTEIIATAPLIQWEHVFNMRTPNAAHPSMRQLMIPLKEEFNKMYPDWNIF